MSLRKWPRLLVEVCSDAERTVAEMYFNLLLLKLREECLQAYHSSIQISPQSKSTLAVFKSSLGITFHQALREQHVFVLGIFNPVHSDLTRFMNRTSFKEHG